VRWRLAFEVEEMVAEADPYDGGMQHVHFDTDVDQDYR
jgi:hypothetical protein